MGLNGLSSEVRQTLNHLQESSLGILGVSLTGIDGNYRESTLPGLSEQIQVSAISAASLAVAKKGAKDTKIGGVKQVQITGDSGFILLLDVGTRAVLTVIADTHARIEPVLRQAQVAVDHLSGLI
jgi:predicted regulator of Ras-like GTPase activity (Roadblock/LC7/MglB family)